MLAYFMQLKRLRVAKIYLVVLLLLILTVPSFVTIRSNAQSDKIRLVAKIPAQYSPEFFAYDSANKYVYVDNYNGGNLRGSVSVIDGSTNKNIANITVGSSPFGILYNPSNEEVYVANSGGPARMDGVFIIKGTKMLEQVLPGANTFALVYDSADKFV